MSNARDELAELIWDEDACDWRQSGPNEVADAILAAGYVKQRVIATDVDLETLPEGTTIVDQCERLTFEETSIGCLEWVDRHGNACWVELPATVLYEPTP